MTKDTGCVLGDERESALMAYLYDEAEPRERAAFDRHLAGCMVCRVEMAELSEVRAGLSGWATPEVSDGVGGKAPRHALRLVDPSARRPGWRRFADAPVWLQAAAAMLVVGAALGMANLNLTYSRVNGLTITTGWLRASAAPALNAPQPAAGVPAQTVSVTPWRDDLSALEAQLLQVIKSQPEPTNAGDAALLKQVRQLVQESERRQQNETLLRVSELAKEVQVQRQGDLQRIDQMFGVVQNRTGIQVRQQQQQFNELLQRVSQQR